MSPASSSRARYDEDLARSRSGERSRQGMNIDMVDLAGVENMEAAVIQDGDYSEAEGLSTAVYSTYNDEDSDADSVVYQKDPETGLWECRPYKAQLLKNEVEKANEDGSESHDRIVAKLNELGVRVFVVPHQTSVEMFDDIHHVSMTVAKDNRCRCHADNQSCLLYQDEYGRLYNLTIKDHAVGIAGRWQDAIAGFSGFEAMVALTVLTRVFPCANDSEVDGELAYLKPGAAVVLILGLVFSEETSMSWVNTAMFVRGIPSIAAYALTPHLGNDWLRKIMIITLALAAASTGNTARGLTIFGAALACTILLANLGSRAWHNLQWLPLQYDGFGAPVLAYMAAVGTGLLFPYMGHREIEAGGKAGVESVIRCAFFVGAIFVLTNYSEIRDNIVVNSSQCNQKWVNFTVGIWFTITLLTSLQMVKGIPPAEQWPETDGEPLLKEDQTSPVGFIVPNLPVFPVQPILAKNGNAFCTVSMEVFFGFLLAVGLGGFIIYTAFADVENDVTDPTTPWG